MHSMLFMCPDLPLALAVSQLGDLGSLIAKMNARGELFAEEFVMAVLLDLAHGIAMLHQNRICHRDLKPPNVFISKEGIFKVPSHPLMLAGVPALVSLGRLRGALKLVMGRLSIPIAQEVVEPRVQCALFATASLNRYHQTLLCWRAALGSRSARQSENRSESANCRWVIWAAAG